MFFWGSEVYIVSFTNEAYMRVFFVVEVIIIFKQIDRKTRKKVLVAMMKQMMQREK